VNETDVPDPPQTGTWRWKLASNAVCKVLLLTLIASLFAAVVLALLFLIGTMVVSRMIH